MSSIVIALVWQWTPFMMLIILAGLQSKPLDVIEAAKIDGCSDVADLPLHDLPAPAQYLELAGLLGAIYVVQNFDAVSRSRRAGSARPTCRSRSTRSSTTPTTTAAHRPPAWWSSSARSSSRPSRCAPCLAVRRRCR
jgi:ABC-type sugar transport system permease subunit